ncbi:MAG TPA: nuclear transport factor 2 family protein [Cyclobacteriaceae bacterium]|jgi:uncharacterized protein (TIGR02246 family)|nr:nuclear transport factor 2 family protein [Cyclobacteriaceae bacterium]
MTHFKILVVALAFLSLTSCKENSKEKNISGFNLDSAKQSIEHQNVAFQTAFETSDSVGLGNLFTSDAKMMMPGSPSIEGRAAITSMAAMFMKMKVKRVAKTIDVWGNDDLLTEEGTASLFDQKGVELDHAKYLVIWKKEDGQWKLFRDMWNSDLTPKK